MNILKVLKQKHEKQKNLRWPTSEPKKQLNTVVNTKMFPILKKLAAEYSVPQYAIVEHLLEVGAFYAFQILKSRQKREMLRNHLIDRHMLESGYQDPEDLIRLGEGRYASELLQLAKIVIQDTRVLQRAVTNIKRTGGNLNYAEERYQKLFKSALKLADWLTTHPLDEPEHDETDEN
jgi:hypothetical protein